MKLLRDWRFSSDSDDNNNDMCIDYDLEEALKRSLEYPTQTLHSFTEEMHLKRALSESLTIKQPYFTSATEKLIALIFPVRDLFIPILVERGNLRDLHSFCTTNRAIYRIYKSIEEKCLNTMMDYRLVPLEKIRTTYTKGVDDRFTRNPEQGKSCAQPCVVSFCDTAYSLKIDTRLYIREYKPSVPYQNLEYVYFTQDQIGADFCIGIYSNEKIKAILSYKASNYRLQLLMG